MRKYLLTAGFALMATPALAHHPLGGMPLETFVHGALSGVAHPILGFDHLFFVALVGIAALYTGRPRVAPAAYIMAMLAGCFMMSMGISLPDKEILIGLSLLALGTVVLSGRSIGLMPMLVLFAGFGLFHGSAFGDSIASEEAAIGGQVLAGYLIGLGIIQYAIALAAGWVATRLWKATSAKSVEVRIAGAAVAGVGLFLTLENAEGLLFNMLSWSA